MFQVQRFDFVSLHTSVDTSVSYFIFFPSLFHLHPFIHHYDLVNITYRAEPMHDDGDIFTSQSLCSGYFSLKDTAYLLIFILRN